MKTSKALTYLNIGLLLVSFCILIIAAANDGRVGAILKIADVTMAFLIIGILFTVNQTTSSRNEEVSINNKLYVQQYLAAGVFVGLEIAIIWFFGDRINLNILLPGLAWRSFVVVNMVPFVTILHSMDKKEST